MFEPRVSEEDALTNQQAAPSLGKESVKIHIAFCCGPFWKLLFGGDPVRTFNNH